MSIEMNRLRRKSHPTIVHQLSPLAYKENIKAAINNRLRAPNSLAMDEVKRVRFSSYVSEISASPTLADGDKAFVPNFVPIKEKDPAVARGSGFWREMRGQDRWDADKVCEQVYIGSMEAAQDFGAIGSIGISHVVRILSLNCHTGRQHPNVRYLILRLDDSGDEQLQPLFRIFFRFMKRALCKSESRVLVHCMMGISRSVSMMCAFLIKTRSFSAHHALEHIRRTRLEAQPNDGFIQQLEEYEWAKQLRNSHNTRHRKLKRAVVRGIPAAHRQPINQIIPIILQYVT